MLVKRDGRTICGPQCVPKSTSVTLAVDEKTLPMATITGRTDRQTDRRTDSATQYAAPPREEGRIKTHELRRKQFSHCCKHFICYERLNEVFTTHSLALTRYRHHFAVLHMHVWSVVS